MPPVVAGAGTSHVAVWASAWEGLIGSEQVSVDQCWRLGLCNWEAVGEGTAVPVWWGEGGVE